MKYPRIFPLLIILLTLLCVSISAAARKQSVSWPQRVLITNDDGIESVGLIELARAFSTVAETYVVAPRENRSGSSHYLSALTTGMLMVEPRALGDGIHAYAVDGFPADCVWLALTGIMRDNPPDLVISGINDEPNLGMTWLFSGTIGAARMAAFFGTPAIALSGLKGRDPDAVQAVMQWVLHLTQSPVVRELQTPQFLNVNIPRRSPTDIQGVRLAKPADWYAIPGFARVSDETGEQGEDVWGVEDIYEREYTLPLDSDEGLYDEGYIVITLMVADEYDERLLVDLAERSHIFPEWPSP